MKKKYKTQASELIKANFWMAGVGHFNITLDEIALVLEYLDNGDYQLLHELYERLSEERLG